MKQQRIHIDNTHNSIEQAIHEAVRVLEDGGILLYPTDTIYGLGVDMENKEAIQKLSHLKRSEESKKMLVIAAGLEMAEKYAHFNEKARALANTFWPGPLTLLLPERSKTGEATQDKIGIRVSDHAFCLELVKTFGRPIVSTSANVSGQKTQQSVDTILKQFGSDGEQIVLVVDQGAIINTIPSTIIDLSTNEPEVIRAGSLLSIADFVKVLYK